MEFVVQNIGDVSLNEMTDAVVAISLQSAWKVLSFVGTGKAAFAASVEKHVREIAGPEEPR